jgi:hypothetical protein
MRCPARRATTATNRSTSSQVLQNASEGRTVSAENVLKKIQSVRGKPACIEARWDGGTQGWHIGISIVMEKDDA